MPWKKLWQGDRVVELKQRWEDNQTLSEIGNAMGTTRNAIAGALHRLRVNGERLQHVTVVAEETRLNRVRSNSNGKTKPTASTAPDRKSIGEIMKQHDIEAERPATRPCSILDLDATTCRWPHGEPQHPDFYFCGAQVEDGFPYCTLHCCRAYVPSHPRYVR